MSATKNPKISIIVPVYMTEKYLDKCVRSILEQTFTDFELILVDDGSFDNCCELCDRYENMDARVKVIHKKNGGLSSARNTGISLAKGEYVGFVDSDDYIAPDMYETLYRNMVDNHADISVCGLYNCFDNNEIVPQYNKEEFLLLSGEEALKLALEGVKFSVHAVNKLYKKELLNGTMFPEGKLSEDAFLIPKLLPKAKKVVVFTAPKYYYMHREGTITTCDFKPNDFDVVLAYSENLDMVNKCFPKLKKQAEFRYLWAYMYVLDKMILSTNFTFFDEYKNTVFKIRKNTAKILLNPHFSIKRKFGVAVLFFSTGLYKKLINRNNKKIN